MQVTRISPWGAPRLASLAAAIVGLSAVACSDYSAPSSGYPVDTTGARVVAVVTVTPASRTLVAGDTVNLAARATDAADYAIEGRPVTWLSTNNAVASVNAAGVVLAISPGTVTIRATIDGKVGEASLTVTSPVTRPAVARVEVGPSTVTLGVGSSATLVAKAFDADGHQLTDRPTTWASRDSSIAGVDSTGRVIAKAAGTTLVSAIVDGHLAEAPATVTVTATTVAPVASIAVTPVGFVLDAGQTRQLTAIVLDAAGNRLTDRVVTWSSDSPEVATVSSTGLVTAIGYGYATITAMCEGKTFSLAVTVSYGD
jgi:uncharacterized protein YjdB